MDPFLTANVKQPHSTQDIITYMENTQATSHRGVLSVIFPVHINYRHVKIFTDIVPVNFATPRKARRGSACDFGKQVMMTHTGRRWAKTKEAINKNNSTYGALLTLESASWKSLRKRRTDKQTASCVSCVSGSGRLSLLFCLDKVNISGLFKLRLLSYCVRLSNVHPWGTFFQQMSMNPRG